MFDANKIFKERLSAYVSETSRYLKYIFNGHIAVATFFLISAIAVYYQQWLATLPTDFPSAWIIAIVFGFLVSYTPVKSLLVEPDLVFLIPAEHKMKSYFRNALVFSYVHQLLLTLFVIAAISPLYFHTYADRGGRFYLLTIIVLFIFKAWNLIGTWSILKNRNKNIRSIDHVIRFGLNFITFFFIIEGEILFASITTFILIIMLIYNILFMQKSSGIAWDILVEKDQHQMQLFYRMANLFTDVPHLKKRFKKRRLLVSLLSRIPFSKKHTYDYLYRITFVRSGDYLGMYARLIIIGGLLIYFVPNEWMKLIFALLFIYMSVFQITTLYHHYRTNIWIDLYPIEIKHRQHALKKWLFQLTLIQTILFSLLFLILKLHLYSLLTFIGGIVFSIIFIKLYVEKKIMN